MKTPAITKLIIPEIIQTAAKLECKGKLARSQNNLTYLDIDDAYIHKLFPLLPDKEIKIPNYFGKGSAGAHITVIYPEECKEVKQEDLNKEHHFSLKEIIAAEISQKHYYALLVNSDSLLELRRKYNLPDLLCFKGYAIGFHITIGTRLKGVEKA